MCVDVWVTDNSSTKRRGQYIAYTVTRAADGPDGMEARGRPFSADRKGLNVDYTFPWSGVGCVASCSNASKRAGHPFHAGMCTSQQLAHVSGLTVSTP